jgi:hypothetical protein
MADQRPAPGSLICTREQLAADADDPGSIEGDAALIVAVALAGIESSHQQGTWGIGIKPAGGGETGKATAGPDDLPGALVVGQGAEPEGKAEAAGWEKHGIERLEGRLVQGELESLGQGSGSGAIVALAAGGAAT